MLFSCVWFRPDDQRDQTGFVREERAQGRALNLSVSTFWGIGKKWKKTSRTVSEPSALAGSSCSDHWILLLFIWKVEMVPTLCFQEDDIETKSGTRKSEVPVLCQGSVCSQFMAAFLLRSVFVQGHAHQWCFINVCWVNEYWWNTCGLSSNTRRYYNYKPSKE